MPFDAVELPSEPAHIEIEGEAQAAGGVEGNEERAGERGEGGEQPSGEGEEGGEEQQVELK